jgi:hypothetical protein
MEGHHPHARSDITEEPLEPLLHLSGGLVREGDGQDLLVLHAAGRDEMRDPVREHTCLPRPRAGHHEDRPFGRQDSLALSGI